jgi:hypothetical protein
MSRSIQRTSISATGREKHKQCGTLRRATLKLTQGVFDASERRSIQPEKIRIGLPRSIDLRREFKRLIAQGGSVKAAYIGVHE